MPRVVWETLKPKWPGNSFNNRLMRVDFPAPLGPQRTSTSFGFYPTYVFISPPSMQVLEKRLRDRKTETEAAIEKRLETARKEMKYRDIPGFWDLVLINDDFPSCYEKFKAFVVSQCDVQSS
mmetsp:Transcript_16746/g.16607  ORF Transcript_16746/g.16607 Transcript_16746/m.16607 type:complete len:122 (-) Transcript_16746:88-453(-)